MSKTTTGTIMETEIPVLFPWCPYYQPHIADTIYILSPNLRGTQVKLMKKKFVPEQCVLNKATEGYVPITCVPTTLNSK